MMIFLLQFVQWSVNLYKNRKKTAIYKRRSNAKKNKKTNINKIENKHIKQENKHIIIIIIIIIID
jgi:hypothetical protein